MPDKEFSGTDRSAVQGGRSGPLQFEKDEDDPFGLEQFLKQAKGSSKRPSNYERDRKDDKRRRH